MTPAVRTAKKQKVVFTLHEYTHDPSCESYGIEAAEKLGVEEKRVFKTLVADIGNGDLAVAVLPVNQMLNMKQFAKALNVKKASMAEPRTVERVTGYVLGGVSPLGQKKRLKTVIHETAETFETIFVSAGKRGLDIELSPLDLKTLTSGKFAGIC